LPGRGSAGARGHLPHLTLAKVTVKCGMFISIAGPLDRLLPLTVSGT
jgi:hypothetical protein